MTTDTAPRVMIALVHLEPLLRDVAACLKDAPCCPKSNRAWFWYDGQRAEVLKRVEAVLGEVAK